MVQAPRLSMPRNQLKWILAISLLALLSRLPFISQPYFVDGPAHFRAVTAGVNFIQPPGYFLFNEVCWILSRITGLSASASISALNVFFSTLGAAMFGVLAFRVFPSGLGLLLSIFYAFSDIVWFVSDIHSTYAGMTFFAPALLYVLLFTESGWLAGLTWALMTGFRPSDGVFVIPFVAWIVIKRPKQILPFLATALPIVALWYVPTMRHFGGGLLSPLHSAANQVDDITNGLLAKVSLSRKVAGVIHLGTAAFDAWGLLVLALIPAFFIKSELRAKLLIYILSGWVFFALWFFSDPSYLSYMIAPGVILAGFAIQKMGPVRAQALLGAAIFTAILQMVAGRPIPYHNSGQAVLDSYVLEYSAWGLRHGYFLRLKTAMAELSTNARHPVSGHEAAGVERVAARHE